MNLIITKIINKKKYDKIRWKWWEDLVKIEIGNDIILKPYKNKNKKSSDFPYLDR